MISHHTMLIMVMIGCGVILFAGRLAWTLLRLLLSPIGLLSFFFVRSARRSEQRRYY